MNSMDKTRDFLKSIGMPEGDGYDLPDPACDFFFVGICDKWLVYEDIQAKETIACKWNISGR